MNNILTCKIPEHKGYKFISFCYDDHCNNRRLCELCIHDHNGHQMTSMNPEYEKSKFKNFNLNSSNKANFQNSVYNVDSNISNTLEKCQQIFQYNEKFTQILYQKLMLPEFTTIVNTFSENNFHKIINKVLDESTTQEELNDIARYMKCLQRQDFKTPHLQQNTRFMCSELNQIFDEALKTMKECFDKIYSKYSALSMFQGVDYRKIMNNYQRQQKKSLKDSNFDVDELNKLVIMFAETKRLNLITPWVNQGKSLRQMTQISIIGRNQPELNIQKKLPSGIQDLTSIKYIKSLRSLVKLDLSWNQIGKIENLDGLVDLRELYLDGNNIQKIQNLDDLIELRILSLSYNRIQNFENVQSLNLLQSFLMSSNRVKRVKNLEKLTSLKVLNLKNNLHNIFPAGVVQLRNKHIKVQL